jgi:hypothetical protein
MYTHISEYKNNKIKGEKRIKKRITEAVNLIKVHYMQVWKYHNETPLYR